jgi:hypothetical protein
MYEIRCWSPEEGKWITVHTVQFSAEAHEWLYKNRDDEKLYALYDSFRRETLRV